MANILIVDDSKFMRTIIRDTLEEGSHTIVGETDNGNDALVLYNDLKPDLVTMDITIHGKDGLQTIEEIKALNPAAKVLIVSALSEKTLTNSKNDLIVSGFITKPFKKEVLLEIIKKIL